jgi:hypothetical protein
VPRVCVTPRAIGICEINLDAVDGFRLVLFFRLEDEMLEDRVVACDNTVVG